VTPTRTLVLAHGFLDLAWSWDPVACRLAERGLHCIAFDWRGHGESEWIGTGGYYHFVDYLLDLDELLPQLMEGPVNLVGHSMAGGACAMYAGTRPDRIARLAILEGLGPPPTAFEHTPDRASAWLRGVAQTRAKPQRTMRSPEDALTRMRLTTPDLPEELGLFIARKSTRPAPNGDGLVWSFDPLHKTTSPMPFRAEIFAAFCQRIIAPTLLIFGEHGFRLPDEAERSAHIAYHQRVEIPKTGHMMHWLAPDAVAKALGDFFVQA
jgi:pimeloyl-ACP methyl ester carboxylesterase